MGGGVDADDRTQVHVSASDRPVGVAATAFEDVVRAVDGLAAFGTNRHGNSLWITGVDGQVKRSSSGSMAMVSAGAPAASSALSA